MAKPQEPLIITVLSGGPDAEAMISRKSAAAICDALRTAGHLVHEMDLPTNDPSSLLHRIPQDHVVFPALHGPWGEGGGAQSHFVGVARNTPRMNTYYGSEPSSLLNKYRFRRAWLDN